MQFWIDLTGEQFSDSEPKWIQAFPLKKYFHPVHGEINFTPERAMRFADNVKNKVRGQDLDIDYDHKVKSGEAAGWVVDAEAKLNEADPSRNGLWIAVQFTKDAAQKVKDKAYRYFSPEFKDSWTHPSTNQTFSDVLFGGALTNRPFLKDILPINLSEIIADEPKLNEGGQVPNLKEILGLPDTATDEEVAAAAQALKDKNENPVVDPNKPNPTVDDKPTARTQVDADGNPVVQASESLVKLAEDNPELAKILSEHEALKSTVESLAASTRLSEVVIKLGEVKSDNRVLSPAATEKLRDLAIKAPVQLGDEMIDLVKDVLTDGIVELGERGKLDPKSTSNGGKSAIELLNEEVKKFQDENKGASYSEALVQVSTKNPALFDAYNSEVLQEA